MSRERAKAIKQLKELQSSSDIESIHSQADKILCSYLRSIGEVDLVKEYEKIEKWYA